MEDLLESRRPGHGVVPVERYLADVVTGRPDFRAWIRTNDDDADTGFLKLVEGREQLLANAAAERIHRRIADGYDPDVIRDLRRRYGLGQTFWRGSLSPCWVSSQ